MLVVLSADIQAVGIRELLGVAIGRREDHPDHIALPDTLSTEFERLQGHAIGHLYRAVVAQHLLDRGTRQRRVVLKTAPFVWVVQEGEHPVADQVCRGLVARDENEQTQRLELDLAENVALLFHRNECAHEIFTRCRTPIGEHSVEVRGQAVERLGNVADAALGLQRIENAHSGIRPGLELRAIRDGHAQHLRDDEQRKRVREIPNQVGIGLVCHLVEQLADEVADAIPETLNHAAA